MDADIKTTSISVGASHSQFSQVLELRTAVYRSAGKHSSSTLMTDAFDEHSIHIVIWKGGHPIASARIIDLPPDGRWEHDRFVSWPASWPCRSNCAEISRFCIHPKHRSWKTIKSLCEGIAKAMYSTEKDNSIACCTKDMESFYVNFFGAKMSEIKFTHSDLGPETHRMFVCNYKHGLLGVGIKIKDWLGLWPKSTLV